MGLVATTILGMVGSLIGGFIGSLFSSDGRVFDLHPSGLIMSIVGAVVVMLVVGFAGRGRRRVHV
jgi:uncharacterized membrane protein YeaQ/YmgE (transglycosylase-associated protein family)